MTESIPIAHGSGAGDQCRIAHDGAEIVRETGVLDHVAVIPEAQTTRFVQVREFGADIPLFSRIIKVCNAYDDLTGKALAPRAVPRRSSFHPGLGYEYDPRVGDALVRVLAHRQ